MNLRLITAALLAFAIQGLVVASTAPTTVEMGIEASSDTITLPASLPGAIVFPGCASCNRSPLRITTGTTLLLGKKAITLAQLTALAHGSSHFMMIYYRPGSPDITRIVVEGGQLATTP